MNGTRAQWAVAHAALSHTVDTIDLVATSQPYHDAVGPLPLFLFCDNDEHTRYTNRIFELDSLATASSARSPMSFASRLQHTIRRNINLSTISTARDSSRLPVSPFPRWTFLLGAAATKERKQRQCNFALGHP